MSSDFLERYRGGEYESVWDELIALGDMRDSDEMQVMVTVVAHETMLRVKANIRTLAERLSELGFRFGEGLLGETDLEKLQHPYLDDAPVYGFSDERPSLFRDDIARLEALTGGLPVALRVFYEVIGSVNFVGTGPIWQEYETNPQRPLARHVLSHYGSDPLFVWSPKVARESYSDWKEAFERSSNSPWVTAPDAIDIAPSHDYKFGVGGDGPYQVHVPNSVADTPLADEWHHTTFVNYLRICCRWGGFPGLEYHRDKDRLAGLIQDLTHDLIPF